MPRKRSSELTAFLKLEGLQVQRIDLTSKGDAYLSPAYHYANGSMTLCGLEISKYARCEMGLPLGTCAACRVEASIQRATVRT